MNYTLNQLQIFLKISQTQSVTKAAEELNLTQPAVSIQLKNFQDQFDIPLTELVGRKLYITDFGREIAQAAEAILNQVHAINYKTMAYKGQLTGRLRLTSVSTGKYVLPYFLTDFMRSHAGVELALDVTNKSKVAESLSANEVDFALVSLAPDKLQVESLDLIENKLYLVGNNERKFENRVYGKEILQELPLIYREEGSGTRQTMERYIESNNLPVHKKLELTSNEAVKQAVIAGLGYSIMPIIGIKNELKSGVLQIIQVEDLPITTTWRLIWMKGKNHSPVAKALLAHIRQEKEQLVATYFS